MESHPIPQQISSYQFRLVGDMTLKQFFQVAGGALVGLLLYSTNLYPLIKWPLIFISAFIGVALAFLPFQERPLEKWIFAFFRSVYSPTIFSWKKTLEKKAFWKDEAVVSEQKTIPAVQNKNVDVYLSTPTGSVSGFSKKLEEGEKGFLAKLFEEMPAQTNPIAGQIPTPAPVTIPAMPSPAFTPNQDPTRPKVVVEESLPSQKPSDFQLSGVVQTSPGEKTQATGFAQFSPDAAPPNPPTSPNLVVGQVMDEKGKIVESAILEIRDASGRPVRALKTNKLGHFIVVTPLQNGRYEIITEKDGYNFEPMLFDALGSIIPPLAIKGKLLPSIAVLNQAQTNIKQV